MSSNSYSYTCRCRRRRRRCRAVRLTNLARVHMPPDTTNACTGDTHIHPHTHAFICERRSIPSTKPRAVAPTNKAHTAAAAAGASNTPTPQFTDGGTPSLRRCRRLRLCQAAPRACLSNINPWGLHHSARLVNVRSVVLRPTPTSVIPQVQTHTHCSAYPPTTATLPLLPLPTLLTHCVKQQLTLRRATCGCGVRV